MKYGKVGPMSAKYLKHLPEILGQEECQRLIRQAWRDIRAGRGHDSNHLRVKNIDHEILSAIVTGGRTGAQCTAARDMTGRDLRIKK